MCDVSPLHFPFYVYVKLIKRRLFHGILKDLEVMFKVNIYLGKRTSINAFTNIVVASSESSSSPMFPFPP